MLVRSWNLFHGNTVPPQRRAYLDEMIELITGDDPDVVCVQEVPAWALGRFTIGDVAHRPMFGALAGRALTAPNHGVIRSAFAGQGNAIWLAPRLHVLSHHILALNPLRFRARIATELGLDARTRLHWAKERRIVQAIRLDGMVIANTHCTGGVPGITEAELMRAAWFVDSLARPDDVVVLAGDFNLTPDALSGPEWGYSAAGPRIDHILVRGAPVSELRVWPEERRRRQDGTLLSDHAPVELEVL